MEKYFLQKSLVWLQLVSPFMVRLRCQSRSQYPFVCAKISQDSPGDAGSGSVGCIRTDRDGRTTMSETLRFNIVIFLVFTERETYICVVHVPPLGISDVEYTISFLIPGFASLAFEIFVFLFSKTYNAFRWCNLFRRNFW